jgi:tetratricopeptide (TPR) repeat protein
MQLIIVDIQKQIDANTATGSQNLYTDGWLDLALYRNMLGDVTGAKEVWVYLTKVSPGLVQPYGNMANQFVVEKNFAEAETWYKIAIEKMPQALQYYQDLADVYIAQKRTADAIATLKAGIAADAKSWSLQVTLGRLYLAQGDVKGANAQFDAAIARAKAAGNTAAVEAIQQEKK